MADERYEWLDKGAAERLLRGEPVGPVGDRARAQAERLSSALDAVARAGGPEGGEIPGEAAALAAFRKARAASPEVFSTVGGGRKAPAPVRWGRPVRIGLAGALAGVALGGVAVAAGTGVLPGPFGHDADPAPASSVSAVATPHPADPGAADGGPGVPGGPAPGIPGIPGGAGGTPGSGTGGAERDGDGRSGGESGGTHAPSPGPDTGAPTTGPGSADAAPGTDGGSGSGSGTGPDSGSGDWYRKTAEDCQDYRTGDLAPDRERRLETAAKGADRVERFCDRLLKGADGVSGTAGAGGAGGNGDGAGEGHGDGGSGGDAGGGSDGDRNGGSGGHGADGGQGVRDGIRGSVPQVSFTRPAPQEPPALAPSITVALSPQLG
ncbi:hypothetical protein [Streptomyces sp. Wb2n-11]|uniref:hypothetical protein n=1 Tax=Streptomyces sp. Wb2n-11 TaxID=1030533 RepID=UPI000A8AA491|nr:hypothetical protein [Streptomyces sp. Wb2n-11]